MQHYADKYPWHKKQPISLHFPDFIENVLEKNHLSLIHFMSSNLPDFLTYAYLLWLFHQQKNLENVTVSSYF